MSFWQPLFFLGVCYNWVVPDQSFLSFYITLVCISFAGSGIGIVMSMLQVGCIRRDLVSCFDMKEAREALETSVGWS